MKRINDQKLQQRIGWTPHPHQREILNAEGDLTIAAGRGFGKTSVAAYITLKKLLADDKSILVVAPTYDLTKRVLQYIEKWIGLAFPGLLPGIIYKPYPLIKTPWNTTLEGKSAENAKGMLGKRYDLTVVDEAAKIKKDVWETYIFPTTQITGGRIIKISTPFGLNWFHQSWIRDKEHGGAFKFRSIDNPYFPKEDWEKAKNTLPEQVFQQEYEARFLSNAASVFRGVDEIVAPTLRDVEPGHRYVMGLDLGRHRDFTVITIIDRFEFPFPVRALIRFREIDFTFQKKKIITWAQRYNNAKIIIDARSMGDPIAEDLRRAGLIVQNFSFPGGKSTEKKDLIEKLALYIEQKKLRIPKNDILIDELKAYAYEIMPSGRITYSAPQGLHDDCVISLALAVWGLGQGKKQMTAIQREILKSRTLKAVKNHF